MRLLVVDDSPLDRAIVAEIGGMLGFHVVGAKGGDDAATVVSGADVVLLDGHIPGEDVGAVAARLRRTNATARIILWSGAPDAVERTLPAGTVDQAMEKPLDLAGMEDALAQLLAAARPSDA